MIIWQGLGILVPVIIGAILFIIPGVFKAVIPHDAFASYFKYISSFSILLGAMAVWFLGKKLNGGKGQMLTDEQTGEKVMLKAKHTLFFINMEYWAIPALIFPVLILFL